LNGGAPSPFHEKYLKRIKAEVEKYRDEMDTPFDEIYHKERKLVSDIVRAMQSIKDIESKLPNPAANRMFDPKDIDEDPVYGDMYSSAHEPQYIRDKKLEEKMNKANLSQLKENLGETRHQYNQIEKQTIEDLIASGQINREEFEIAKSRALANR
jgi:cell pole-organizing protein PopZ